MPDPPSLLQSMAESHNRPVTKGEFDKLALKIDLLTDLIKSQQRQTERENKLKEALEKIKSDECIDIGDCVFYATEALKEYHQNSLR